MALTKHYECDVCKSLKDPRGNGWERQANDVYLKISGSMPQMEHKMTTVCHDCSQAICNAIQETINRLQTKDIL